MITPINNVKSNIIFQGTKLKMPKKLSTLKNQPIQNKADKKITNFIEKTKNEFKNMDEETADLLLKTVALIGFLMAVVGFVSYQISLFIDKFQN